MTPCLLLIPIALGHDLDVVRADFGITLILALIAFALSQAFAPKPNVENARPASLGDFSAPTTTEDRSIPIVFGTVKVAGPNVIWYGDLQQIAITESIKINLWRKKRIVTGYKYRLGLQFAVGYGAGELLKIYVGDKLAWSGSESTEAVITVDEPKFFGGDDLGSGGLEFTASWYPGTATQSVNAYLEDFQDAGAGTDRTPAYNRLAHLVVERGYIGNSTSIAPWAFEYRRIGNPLLLPTLTAELNSGNDANPANVLYEILTDSVWGLGTPAADIDVASFEAAADVLKDEQNGVSIMFDSARPARDMRDEICRQIDGRCFIHPATGKWTLKLLRDDYDIDDVLEVTESNCLEIESWTVGTWSETVSEIRAVYSSRANDYASKTATAIDLANSLLQGGKTFTTGRQISSPLRLPAVKDDALAQSICWREHRLYSHPLIRARLVLTRQFWAVSLGDVLAVSLTIAGTTYTKLPMRVIQFQHGAAGKRSVAVDLVQDVFGTAAAISGPPEPTLWVQPTDDLDPFDVVLVMESPRGIVARDPVAIGEPIDRLWCGAKRKGNEVGFEIRARVSPDAYTPSGEVYGTMIVGTLNGALARGAAQSTSFTITLASAADRTELLAQWSTGLRPTDVGTNLQHLVQIGNEFLLITTIASGSGTDVTCTGVYRGVLDSVQQDHAHGATVYAMFTGGSTSEASIAPASTVDVKLLPFSATDAVAEGDVTAVSVTTSNRLRRPIPPGRVLLNGTIDDVTSVSLEGTGSGDSIGIGLELRRRDFRSTDETASLASDAAALFSDFPSANTTEYEVEVRNDPAGANTLLFTVTWAAGPTFQLERNDILKATDGVLPTTLGLVIATRHDYEGTSFEARYDLAWAFTVATGLTGQFNFGALDQAEVSSVYTATVNGTYAFTINTALAAAVEYRLNGGSWTTLIAAAATSGSILGVVATDTIEIRHGDSTSGALTFLAMAAAGAGQDGYAILYKP